MGPSADHPFPYPPPSEYNLALAQVPFATRELGVKALDSSFSKRRYPRCDMGMAPSALARVTYNRRLGQTLALLATRDFASWSVEPSCSSFANPRDARGQRYVDSAKRRVHATYLLRCTLLTSCVAVARRKRPRLSTFRDLSDQGATSLSCETSNHDMSTMG
jgi:hypothetical protein